MKIKRYIYIIPFCLLCYHLAEAQKKNSMLIGDRVPDFQLKQIYGSPLTKVKLSDFKGKMILIDFWATWCSPCVSSMPFLDSLQSQFADDLQIICVTREDDKTIKAAYNHIFPNKRPQFLTIINDTLLAKNFPHQTIPHCVWIDKNGKVMAITDKADVNASSIQLMLAGNVSQIKNTPELKKLDLHKPPYASNQLNFQDEFLYHSLITKYREDIKTNYSRGRRNEYIACTNSSIIRLYQCAVGKFDLSWLDMNRVVCRGFKTFTDSASIGLFKSDQLTQSWLSKKKEYAFTYELAVSDSVYSKDQLFSIMFEDLNRYFAAYGLSVVKKMGSHKFLALTLIKGRNFKSFKDSSANSEKYFDKKYFKVINHPMEYLLSQLEAFFPTKYPLINQTSYDGMASIELEIKDRTLTSINKALSVYGLKLEEKEAPIEVLEFTKVAGTKKFL